MQDVVAADARQARLAPAHRARVGVRGKQQRAPIVAHQRLGRGVLDGLQLFDAARAQFVELFRRKTRPQHRIAQQLQHQCAVAGQELAAHQQRLALRTRIQVAARALDRIGPGIGIARAGTVGEQVGRERRRALAPFRVLACAAAQHQVECHQRQLGTRHQDQPQAVGQHQVLVRGHRYVDVRIARRCRHGWQCRQQASHEHQHSPHDQCSAAARGCRIPTVRCRGLNTSRATASTCAAVTAS